MSGAYWVGPEPAAAVVAVVERAGAGAEAVEVEVVVVVVVERAAAVAADVVEEGVRRRTQEGVGEREMSLIKGKVPAKTAMMGPHHRSLHQQSPHPPVASSDVFG